MNNHPVYSHDRKGDILYISFSPGEKEKTAVKLTYDILLRFNRAEKRAIGITILNYSDMIKDTERRQQNNYIPLNGLDDLEPDWQDAVIETLKRPPANYEVKFYDDVMMGQCVHFKHFDSFFVQEKPQRMAA